MTSLWMLDVWLLLNAEETEACGRGPVPAQLHKMHARYRVRFQAGQPASALTHATSLGSIAGQG